MTRLLKSLIPTFLFVRTQCEDFQVTSCNNNNTLAPEITIQITKEYFESYLAGRENDFIFSNDFYEKTFDQDDLQLSFSDDGNGKRSQN